MASKWENMTEKINSVHEDLPKINETQGFINK